MRRMITAMLVGLLVLAACGADDDASDATASEAGGEGSDHGDSGEVGSATDDLADGTTASRSAGSAGADASATTDPEAAQTVGLQAGSVDDNDTWEEYLRYREAFAALGIAVDDLPVGGRRVLTVTDEAGVPVHDASVSITGGPRPVTLRTGSDGRAVFLAPVDGNDQQSGTDLVATVELGSATTTAEIGADPHQTIVLEGARRADAVRLDVLFLVDATGSMDDEIERLKANMVGVAEQIAASPSTPDARFALTSYRDDTDDYVSRTIDFTSDVSTFVTALREVSADGGGDYPEALNEAFDEAVHAPSWRLDDEVVRLVFLIGDAPPHIGRGTSYVESAIAAAGRGIRVFPIASSGTDDQAEFVFRQIAQATLGRFVFLSYGAGGAAVGSGSNIDPAEYDVLALDELIVRLVEEQLAPLIS